MHVGRVGERVEQTKLCAYKDVALLALDRRAAIIARSGRSRLPIFGTLDAVAVDDGGRRAGFVVRLLPPRFAAGIGGLTKPHSSTVKSLGSPRLLPS